MAFGKLLFIYRNIAHKKKTRKVIQLKQLKRIKTQKIKLYPKIF